MERKVEIERKYILKRMPALYFSKKYNISQCYLIENEVIVCYRGEDQDGELKYYKILKHVKDNGICECLREEIKQELFLEKYRKSEKKITKMRFVFIDPSTDLKWEIDKFALNEIIIAELELSDFNKKIQFPEELKKVLIKDVTGDSVFDNYNLADDYENF